MIIFEREAEDQILLGDCRVTVGEIRPKRVKLRVEAPSGVLVLRQEVLDRVPDSNHPGFEPQGSIATGGTFKSRAVGRTFEERRRFRSTTFSRKQGEKIVIGDCRATVIKIHHANVILGIEAPANVPVVCAEFQFNSDLPPPAGARITPASTEPYVSVEDLLDEVGRLEQSDLGKFVAGALKLRAMRSAPLASERESEILLRINEGLPEALSRRLDELAVKRVAEVLTDDEHGELIRLSDEVERRETERVKLLEELAALRHLTLPVLMRSMGLTVPVHG